MKGEDLKLSDFNPLHGFCLSAPVECLIINYYENHEMILWELCGNY